MLSDVVDTIVMVLVRLAVVVHHGGLVPLTGEAVLLEVTFLSFFRQYLQAVLGFLTAVEELAWLLLLLRLFIWDLV